MAMSRVRQRGRDLSKSQSRHKFRINELEIPSTYYEIRSLERSSKQKTTDRLFLCAWSSGWFSSELHSGVPRPKMQQLQLFPLLK